MTENPRREVWKIDTKLKVEIACKIAGISVTQLGKKMGLSQQNISKRLKVGKFTQQEYEQMAEILGCEYHSNFIFPDGTKVE